MSLDVWMYGMHVGALTRRRGRLTFNYSDEARAEYGLGAPLLSVSLPTQAQTHSGDSVHAFFNGLLPEGEAREMIAYDFGVDADDVLGMLEVLGRDCAGALVVLPAGQPLSGNGLPEPINESAVAERLRRLGIHPLGVDGKVRASLAGLQRKLLLARLDEGWGLPVDGAPSTHIVKPPHHDARFPDMIANEAICMRIAQHLGLSVAPVEVGSFDGTTVLIIERYDRSRPDDAGRVTRVHQEDFCQASGIDGTRLGKYEETGGPSLRHCAEILSDWSRADEQLERLLGVATLNVLVGNGDAHGKNLSLLHGQDGSVELAPAYDVFSTLFYPDASITPGMFVNNVNDIAAVTPDDMVAEAVGWGLDRGRAAARVAGVLERAEAAVLAAAAELDSPEALVAMLANRARNLSAAAAAP